MTRKGLRARLDFKQSKLGIYQILSREHTNSRLHIDIMDVIPAVGADAELTTCRRKTDPTPIGRNPAQERVREESDWVSGISVTGSIQRRRQQDAHKMMVNQIWAVG